MKKYISTAIIFFLLLTSMPIILSNQSNELILYVDDDNTEGPWDGSSTYPYQFINDAVQNAQQNTLIFIMKGHYPEQIIVDKSISFCGEHSEETIVDGENLHAVFVIEDVNHITIENLTITKGSETDGSASAGIVLIQASHIVISHCILKENNAGVLVSQNSSHCILYENEISNNNIGIDICSSSNNLVYGNSLTENSINLGLYTSENNLITKNNIMDSEKNIEFITSKDTLQTNYWGKETRFYLIFGYQYLSRLGITVPWFKCDFSPVPSKNAFDIYPCARIDTTMGSMTLELFIDQMPITSSNFIQLAELDFFDDLVFHRVIDDFVIQGGGYYANGTEKESPLGTIELEIHPDVNHVDGAISMARTNDPNSATSQFFICDGVQDRLDGQYAAFGTIIIGIDALRAIASVETTTKYFFMKDWPKDDVIIQGIEIIS